MISNCIISKKYCRAKKLFTSEYLYSIMRDFHFSQYLADFLPTFCFFSQCNFTILCSSKCLMWPPSVRVVEAFSLDALNSSKEQWMSRLNGDIRSLHVLFAHSQHLPLCRLVTDTFFKCYENGLEYKLLNQNYYWTLLKNHKVVQQQFTGEVKTLNNLLASSFLSLSRTNNY